MDLLGFYKWIAGSMSEFTKPFKDNEPMYKQAKIFWKHLDNSMFIPVIMFILLGIGFAYYYYKPFNNMPGRHYTPKYWGLFAIVTFFVVGLLTFLFEYFVVGHNIQGSVVLEFKVALGNSLYGALVYLLTSVLWCNVLSTNAYRFFKF